MLISVLIVTSLFFKLEYLFLAHAVKFWHIGCSTYEFTESEKEASEVCEQINCVFHC